MDETVMFVLACFIFLLSLAIGTALLYHNYLKEM